MATGEVKQLTRTLNRLISLSIASEKGFNVAAENVKNRGLQIMFKAFAQERAQFAKRLSEIVRAMGVEPADGSGFLAAAHRGWINIKAAMTIGQPATERVVLGEVVRGERVAESRYEDVLSRPLPPETREVVSQQHERVREVLQRAQELLGNGETRLVVRLFDTETDAAEAEEELLAAGFDADCIKRVPLSQVLNLYEGQHVMDLTAESGLAGAIAGAALGILLGIVAGVSGIIAPGNPLFSMSVPEIFLTTILLGAIAGLFFGALIGAIIGLGVSQEDEYRYANSVRLGSLLLLLEVETRRAGEATDIMKRVNARRWRLAT